MVLPWFMLRVRDLMNLDWPVCSPQSEVLCTHFLGWPVCSPLSEVLCTHLLDWPVCSPQSEVLCTHLPAHRRCKSRSCSARFDETGTYLKAHAKALCVLSSKCEVNHNLR